MRRRRRTRGFTLVEVMVSLGIMTMGAMAIIALLAHIMRANGQARHLNNGMNIAETWVDRLKQDAHSWTQAAAASGSPTPAQVLANTLYLRNVASPPSAAFIRIPATSATISAAFGPQGQPISLPAGSATFTYCAAYRANWIYFGSTMRVDVRVFWAREGVGANIMTDWPDCDGDHGRLDAPSGSLLGRYHVLYYPSAIGVTPVPR